MKRCLLAFLFVAGALRSGAAAAASLDVYGQLPSLSDAQISPDGATLAYAAEIKGKRIIVLQTLSPTPSITALDLKNQKLRGLRWADADHLLITTSKEEDAILDLRAPAREWYVTASYDIAKRKQMTLLTDVPDAMNVTYGEPQPRRVNGRTVVFVEGQHFENHQGERALYLVDLVTGRALLMAHGHGAQDWIIDGNGNMVAESDYDESRERWSLRLRRGSSWDEVYALQTAIDKPYMVGLSADGAGVIVNSNDTGRLKSRIMAIGTGSWGPTLDRPLVRAIQDPMTHRIVGSMRETATREYDFTDPDLQNIWESIDQQFPHEDVTLVSYSDDRNRFVIQVAGLPDGCAYYLVDRKTGGAHFIGNIYDGLTADDLAPVRPMSYRAADGLLIPAYLTLPKNRDPKNLPLIVLPHGGPAGRDQPGFDWWSQALASRGYAVLQPEFRGSTGFTENLLSQGYGQWGRKMQTDLADGVQKLAADGLIDPKRVCIVGASYGGYAALAGVTLDTGTYRCAVSVAGLSNLRDFLRWVQQITVRSDSAAMRFWDRYLGARDMDDPVLDQLSPVKHVDAITVPVLLIHGRDDTVVPIGQSQQMLDATKRANKPVEFVKLNGEDHWLSRSETRLQMLEATVKFLEANNPPN